MLCQPKKIERVPLDVLYPNRYIVVMFQIYATDHFIKWLSGLKDKKAKARVAIRLARIENGLLGDHKSIGNGISELRIDYGPGYRIYYTIKNGVLVVLLVGGDKSGQQKDIEKARHLLKEYEVKNA